MPPLLHFFGGRVPLLKHTTERKTKVGTLILTSLLEDLVGFPLKESTRIAMPLDACNLFAQSWGSRWRRRLQQLCLSSNTFGAEGGLREIRRRSASPVSSIR